MVDLQISSALLSSGGGLQWLTKALHLCSPLTSGDISYLKDWISETWLNLAMVDYPYEANFLQPLPAWPIKVTEKCLLFFYIKYFSLFFDMQALTFNIRKKSRLLRLCEINACGLESWVLQLSDYLTLGMSAVL